MNQVFEREFDAFGITGRAGSVDEDGRVVAGGSGEISNLEFRISNFGGRQHRASEHSRHSPRFIPIRCIRKNCPAAGMFSDDL